MRSWEDAAMVVLAKWLTLLINKRFGWNANLRFIASYYFMGAMALLLAFLWF